MKSKKKLLIEMIICIAIVAAISGVGVFAGIFKSLEDAFGNISINPEVIVRLIVMVFFVIAVENCIILILSLLMGKGRRTTTVLTILQSVAKYAAAIVMICWGLGILGVDVTTIAASIGLVALIIGFGAESLIEDVITGLFMMFENQYNVNDIVDVDGFRGTVTSIGIRTTCIMDPGGNVKIINNSNMKNILNKSNIASRALSEIQVSYATDIEDLEAKLPSMMEAIYKLHEDKMKSEPVYIGVSELGDSGVTLKFVVEVDEQDIYSVQRILNRELLVSFKKANIEIPFPQLDVHQR